MFTFKILGKIPRQSTLHVNFMFFATLSSLFCHHFSIVLIFPMRLPSMQHLPYFAVPPLALVSFSLITAGFFSLVLFCFCLCIRHGLGVSFLSVCFYETEPKAFYRENLLCLISKDELSDHLIYTKLKGPFCKPETKF